jgi:hypothetical protein
MTQSGRSPKLEEFATRNGSLNRAEGEADPGRELGALAHSPGLESITDVECAIERGTYQVWFGARCCAVTEIADYACAKALVVVHGGGDMAEMLDELEPAMCVFARARGCTLIMGTGRKGWERATQSRGYCFGWLTMVKSLP